MHKSVVFSIVLIVKI